MATYYWVGGTGTWNNTSTTNWSATSGGGAGAGPPNSSDTVIFDASSGTGTCTTAATAAASVVTLNSATLGLTLGAAFTMSGAFTLTQGTFNLGGFQLTCLNFVSNNANTRSIVFGATGSVKTTIISSLCWDIRDFTGLTMSGAKQLIIQPPLGSTATTIAHRGLTNLEANSLSFQVIATSGTITIGNTNIHNNIDFSSFTMTSPILVFTLTIYGNLKLSATTSFTASTNIWTFAATSGTKTIESAGVTYQMPLTFNGSGGTWQLVDNLTVASDKTITLTNGTLDGNSKNVSAGLFALGAGTKTLTLGSGTWTITGSGASAWNASTNSAGLTVSASTGTISLTSASAKTFSGGGFTWPTLNQGGAGALTITGSSAFANITNTYGATGATTITFTAGTTQTVSRFTASGTVGKVLTLNSNSAGTRFNLSDPSGLVSVSYCDIKDSNVIGGARWLAYLANGNVNSGNNLGWRFSQGEGLNIISGLSGTRGLSIGVGLVGNL